LSNVKLVELPDSVVFDLIGQRKSTCAKAIEFRRRNGQHVSIVKSVIQANARYKLQFAGGADAKTRADMTSRVAADLGLTANERAEGEIQGEGLFWGVRDDSSLATISYSQPPSTGARTDHKLLPTDRPAKVILDVDSRR
jgi:hypothetical protein